MAEQNVTVRNASILYKGKRVAYMQTAKYTLNTNDTQEQTDGGTHFTDGRTTGKITCDALVPVSGVGVTIVSDALAHKTIDIAIALIDGKIHQHKARATTLDFSTDVAAGKLTGSFEWMCGTPKVT